MKKDAISAKVTFKVVNGAWEDGTTEDKTVILTGKKGDTLKLSKKDVPAVGNKPAKNYRAGSWGVTPTTKRAITEDTTYTYPILLFLQARSMHWAIFSATEGFFAL